jgi:hypothetical protein
MSEPEPVSIRTFYRIVWTNPATIADVIPDPNPTLATRPEYRRFQTGISVYRTERQARRTGRTRLPWLGRGFVARIVIPEDAVYTIERTTKAAGHYTLWADAASILTWIESAEPVSPHIVDFSNDPGNGRT